MVDIKDYNIINGSNHQDAFPMQAISKEKLNAWKTNCEGLYFSKQLLLTQSETDYNPSGDKEDHSQ